MMRKILLSLLLCTLGSSAFATGQIPELILFGKDTLMMYSTPLYELNQADQPRSSQLWNRIHEANAGARNTALGRGYQGLWELRNDTLRLLAIYDSRTAMSSKKTAKIPLPIDDIIVPGEVATWFSGEIRIAWGYPVTYQHVGFDCDRQHEVICMLEKGVVVTKQKYTNGSWGSPEEFDATTKQIRATFEYPEGYDLRTYDEVTINFTYTPTLDGHFEGFTKATLSLTTFTGKTPKNLLKRASRPRTRVEITDLEHPCLQELARRLRDLKPYGTLIRGEMRPVKKSFYLWVKAP